MLMLVPLLIVVMNLGESIFGYKTVRQQAIRTVLTLLPGTSEFVRINVEAAMQNLSREIVISAVIIVLWASSWIFSIIEKALNRIWRTTSRPFLHGRLSTLGMSILVGTILIASAAVTTSVAVVKENQEQIPVNLPPFFYLPSG